MRPAELNTTFAAWTRLLLRGGAQRDRKASQFVSPAGSVASQRGTQSYLPSKESPLAMGGGVVSSSPLPAGRQSAVVPVAYQEYPKANQGFLQKNI